MRQSAGHNAPPLSNRENDLFRVALDASSDQVYVVDAATTEVIDCNDGACRALGYSRDEVIGLKLTEIDRGIDMAELRSWRESSEALTGELILATAHTRKDGSSFPVEVRARARMHEGRMVSVSICRDITARVALEAEVEAGHQRVESLLRNIPGIAYRRQISPSHRLLWIDERVTELTGAPVADILNGKPRLDEVLSSADIGRVRTALGQAASTGSAYDVTYTMHLPTAPASSTTLATSTSVQMRPSLKDS